MLCVYFKWVLIVKTLKLKFEINLKILMRFSLDCMHSHKSLGPLMRQGNGGSLGRATLTCQLTSIVANDNVHVHVTNQFFFSLAKMLARCSCYSRITSKSLKHVASSRFLVAGSL